MSGLLPRISPTAQNGNFVNLQAVSLNASYAVIGTLSLGTLNLGSLTIASIAGDPNLLLTATSAITLNAGASTVIIPAALVVNNASTVLAINGANNLVLRSDVATAANSIVFSNKTIDSATNTITITNAPLVAANINTLINQDVETTASPAFVKLGLTNQSMGCLYNTSLNLALSPIIAANVFVNVATTATQTLTPGVNFTASNVSITYTGVPTKFFIMSYSATVTTLLNGFYQMRLTRNGAPLNQSIRSGHLHNANTLNNTLESTFIQQLAQNDVIQMQIANNTNTTVLNVQFYTITALELFS